MVRGCHTSTSVFYGDVYRNCYCMTGMVDVRIAESLGVYLYTEQICFRMDFVLAGSLLVREKAFGCSCMHEYGWKVLSEYSMAE